MPSRKVLYYKTRTENDPNLEKFAQANLRVEMLGTFRFCDAKPLFFRLQRLLAESGVDFFKGRKIVVYKIG